ncbi:hypothetical protein [Chromobacterium violaceum]|uniref:Polymyxin resistance protein PmrI n=1 Tax=Chromobacterium violaceum TaxID=536 RepID=A0AAX2MF54_CHRVL|nr:hypothetical protein [Chromobacterium violaceum]SUY93353.1 Polymyxin resistance protein PmrI [Chromobacterium violaceum]
MKKFATRHEPSVRYLNAGLIARVYPEYQLNADKVQVVETTSGQYYGKGYQDVQNRVPKIANTMADLDWKPGVTMADALRGIYDYYRDQVAASRDLSE